MIAALFVAADGVYSDLPDVDPWPLERDARTYPGQWPCLAHPPCQRWGRMWHGGPAAPHTYALGDDDGCFASALASVRRWGGVLEHPAHSHAWLAHGLPWPPAAGGWQRDVDGGWCCHVEQGHYGHASRKATWLYAVDCDLPELKWGSSGQRLDPVMLERHGYEKARRVGVVAMVGGKRKTEIRNATPPEFRDVLLSLAASAVSRTAPTEAAA
jgi:hypothetical protein